MSQGDTGEKTEEATPEKLRKAKEEGQVPKSQDLVGALGFAIGFFTLLGVLAWMAKELRDFALTALDVALENPEEEVISSLLEESLPLLAKATLPVGGAVLVMGVFANVVQTGFFAAFKVLSPKLDKINPINGLKGLFKMKKLVELIKNVLKMAVAAWLAWQVMKSALTDMALTVTLPLAESVEYGSSLIFDYLVKTTVLFLVIGVVDLIWSRRQFNKEQMMSKYDVKQEYKQMEGDPHTKGQRKQLAHELLFGGGVEAVKNADAVIVNPTHIAVAIKYDADSDQAPRVVAKGMRVHAQKIREIAQQYGVPILRNVPLAHALNRLDVDEQIPEELYEAIAEVLSFVYKLREEQEARQRAQAADRRPPGWGPALQTGGLGRKARSGGPEPDPGTSGPRVDRPPPAAATHPQAPSAAPRGADRLRRGGDDE